MRVSVALLLVAVTVCTALPVINKVRYDKYVTLVFEYFLYNFAFEHIILCFCSYVLVHYSLQLYSLENSPSFRMISMK